MTNNDSIKQQKYYIGLDIGTNSVGWACLNEDYKLLKYKGKNMWGARLTDEVKTSVERRASRSARRHYERRKERIRILQELFFDSISKVDEGFFVRLQESFLLNEKDDCQLGKSNVYTLFDGEYNDIEYFKEFPTIYHLQDAMLRNDRKFDIRQIYLAVHHIIKYRGNFLYDGDISDIDTLNNAIRQLFETIQSKTDDGIEQSEYLQKIDDIVAVLQDKSIPRAISKYARQHGNTQLTKREIVGGLFDQSEQKKLVDNLVKAILGYEFEIQTALNIEIGSEEKPMKVSFGNKFEEKRDEICDSLGENADLMMALEKCYNTYMFGDIMQGNDYIAAAMIAKYNKHHNDLIVLKKLMRQMDENLGLYKDGRLVRKCKFDMFKANQKGNYATYVKNQQTIKKSNGNDRYQGAKRDEFYEFVKKYIASSPATDEKEYVLNEIDNESFMPKLNDVSNGAIPYQFYEKELRVILNNQSKYYPELEEIKEKIISILTFRRPYYVGVLNVDSTFGWAKDENNLPLYPRDKKLYPWNFMESINSDKLAENFIVKLSGKCQIFGDEFVLPKDSIVYQAYTTLNELNKISILGHKISRELKKHLFDNVFAKKKTVSVKCLVQELKKFNPNLYSHITESDVSGLSDDKQFCNNMASLYDFRRILGDDFDIKKIEKYDEVIKTIAIFTDKKIRKTRIKHIGDFTEKQIENLAGRTYSGWGRYSKKLLCEIKDVNNKSIIDEMYEGINKKNECYNINELLYDQELGFCQQFPNFEGEKIAKFNFEKHISNLYCSPSVKSIIWQTLCIVEELEKVLKCPPTDIFVETTREDDIKTKKESRYKLLDALYADIKKNSKNDAFYNDAAAKKLSEFKQNEKGLDDEKVFLYLSQMGKCMYTGEVIEFAQLNDCEIDHIVPRAYIKDDSFSNRVLVKRIENQNKTDNLALNQDVIRRMLPFWQYLFDNKLITAKKLKALTKTEFSEKDFNGFINRQLVETNQIVKQTMDLLAKKYERHHIQGIKASITSQFRREQMIIGNPGFAKIRGLNDMHHGKDAYLAGVVGAFTTYTYPCWRNDSLAYQIRQDMQRLSEQARPSKKGLNDLINKRNGIVLTMLEYGDINNSIVIDKETGELINERFLNILSTMAKNDVIVTKKTDEKANSGFYNDTIYPKGKSDNLIPLRYVKDRNGEMLPLNTALYGGYSSEKPEYFVVVKYKITDKSIKVKKGENRPFKDAYALVNIPVLVAYRERQKKGEILEYLSREFNQPEVVRVINKNQLINFKGQNVYISSESELNNATQLVLDAKYDKLLYFVEKGKPNNKELLNEYNKLQAMSMIDDIIPHYVEKMKKCFPLFDGIADKINDFYCSDNAISYKALSFEQKLDYISKLLIVTKSGASRVDIPSNLGGGSSWGRLNSKTIYPNETYMISTSITGLYQTKKLMNE